MLEIILSLIAGLGLGWLLRRYPLSQLSAKTLTLLVPLLLFSMGVQLGQNNQVWNSITTVGASALVVTLCSITGSVLATQLYYKLLK